MRVPLKEAHHEAESGSILWGSAAPHPTTTGTSGSGAEEELISLEGLVPEATSCYIAAIECYSRAGKHAIACSLYSELASHHLEVGMVGQAAVFFEKSAELAELESPQVNCTRSPRHYKI
jgi:hypothetical protein